MKIISSAKIYRFACSFLLVLAIFQPTGGASAQTASQSPTSTAVQANLPVDSVIAEVKRIDKEAKNITLMHGAIKSLDMLPKTMTFQIKDLALLDVLTIGDKILVAAQHVQGAIVVMSEQK